MADSTPLPQASGTPKTGTKTESNSAKLAEITRQQEARFEQRTDALIAELHLARAEAARLRQQSQQLQQVQSPDEQTQRDYAYAKRYYDQASSDREQAQHGFENAQCGFEQAQREHEQLKRDYELLRALLQASQDALLHARPLTAARQRQIDEALRPGGPPATTDDKLAA